MKFVDKNNKGKTWDKRSIMIFFIVVFLLVGVVLFITLDYKAFFIRHRGNWTTTVGRIDSIEKLTGINQTRMGNIISVTGYRIEYTYLVDTDEYHAETIISPLENDFIDFAAKVKNEWVIEIYYKKEKFTDSYVNTDLKSAFYKKRSLSLNEHAHLKGYLPKDSLVSTPEIAAQMAETILNGIYGEKNIEKQKPFVVNLENEIWIVKGQMKENSKGGVVYVEIRKSNGEILKITHGK